MAGANGRFVVMACGDRHYELELDLNIVGFMVQTDARVVRIGWHNKEDLVVLQRVMTQAAEELRDLRKLELDGPPAKRGG